MAVVDVGVSHWLRGCILNGILRQLMSELEMGQITRNWLNLEWETFHFIWSNFVRATFGNQQGTGMPSVAADAISSSMFDGMVQFLRVISLMFSDMSLVISFFFTGLQVTRKIGCAINFLNISCENYPIVWNNSYARNYLWISISTMSGISKKCQYS